MRDYRKELDRDYDRVATDGKECCDGCDLWEESREDALYSLCRVAPCVTGMEGFPTPAIFKKKVRAEA